MPWISKGYAVVGQNAKGAQVYLVALVSARSDADAQVVHAEQEFAARWKNHTFQPGFPRYAILEFRRVADFTKDRPKDMTR